MKNVFTVDGVELAVVMPSSDQKIKSRLEYNKVVRKALEDGNLVRRKLDDYMVEQGLWNETKQKEDDELRKQIIEKEAELAKGGNVNKAKKTAIELRQLRNKLLTLRMERNELDNITAEALGDNAQFDYLVSVCTVYNDTGKPYFTNLDDYREKGETEAAQKAASQFANLYYKLNTLEDNLPEIKFLKRFNFIDDKMRLVNKDGKPIDLDGNVVEDGNSVEEPSVETAVYYEDDGTISGSDV